MPAVSAETRPAAAALPSPQKQSASQASQASQPSKQAAVAAVKGEEQPDRNRSTQVLPSLCRPVGVTLFTLHLHFTTPGFFPLAAHRACCPACGAPPLTEEELATVRKPGRRSTRDANGAVCTVGCAARGAGCTPGCMQQTGWHAGGHHTAASMATLQESVSPPLLTALPRSLPACAADPRNRPENLVKTEFLQQHIVKGGMSLRVGTAGCCHRWK